MLKFLRRNRYDVFYVSFFFFVEQFSIIESFPSKGRLFLAFYMLNLVPWFLHVSSGREVRIKKKKYIYSRRKEATRDLTILNIQENRLLQLVERFHEIYLESLERNEEAIFSQSI